MGRDKDEFDVELEDEEELDEDEDLDEDLDLDEEDALDDEPLDVDAELGDLGVEDDEDEDADEDEDEVEETEDVEEEEEEEGEVGETSLDQLLARRSAARRGTDDAEDEDDILSLTSEVEPGEKSLPNATKVIPVKDRQEFVCTRCHLVKKRSQLADAERVLCRDCV